jgi:hypothetical protein
MQNSICARVYVQGEAHNQVDSCVFKLWRSYFRPDPSQVHYAIDVPVPSNTELRIPERIREKQDIYHRNDANPQSVSNDTPMKLAQSKRAAKEDAKEVSGQRKARTES